MVRLSRSRTEVSSFLHLLVKNAPKLGGGDGDVYALCPFWDSSRVVGSCSVLV